MSHSSRKKILLTIPTGMGSEKLEALVKWVAENAGIEVEDVHALPAGVTVTVLDGVVVKPKKDEPAAAKEETPPPPPPSKTPTHTKL